MTCSMHRAACTAALVRLQQRAAVHSAAQRAGAAPRCVHTASAPALHACEDEDVSRVRDADVQACGLTDPSSQHRTEVNVCGRVCTVPPGVPSRPPPTSHHPPVPRTLRRNVFPPRCLQRGGAQHPCSTLPSLPPPLPKRTQTWLQQSGAEATKMARSLIHIHEPTRPY